MLNSLSRRLAAQTMLYAPALVTGTGYNWAGLFNNGVQGEWLLIRDVRIGSNSASQFQSALVTGTNAGALSGTGLALDPTAPTLAGQVYTGRFTTLPTFPQPQARFWPANSNVVTTPWPFDRPIAVVTPGQLYYFVNFTLSSNIQISLEWLVIDPKELS